MTQSSGNTRLFLIDAFSMIYRGYFALSKNPMINKQGVNTTALFGFANMMIDLLKNEKPTHIAVVLDSEKPTFRAQEFVEYKAQREPMPEDIINAIPHIIRFLKLLQIPVLQMDGYEADDIIGTIAIQAAHQGFQVYIVSTDKDFGQILSDKIFLYKPGNYKRPTEILDADAVCKKYRIPHPSYVIDILGLWGDASDNIPGVPGIGEKYAVELVSQYGSIENIIEQSDNIQPSRLARLIKEHADQALLSKKLVTIDTHVPVNFEETLCRWLPPDPQPLLDFFQEMDFRTLSRRLMDAFYTEPSAPSVQHHGIQSSLFDEPVAKSNSQQKIRTFQAAEVSYSLIQTEEQLLRLQQMLLNTDVFSFDTETTGLNFFRDTLIGISFSVGAGQAFYVPCVQSDLGIERIRSILQPVFSNKQILKVAHNLKFDIHVLRQAGFQLEGPFFDTMIAFYLLDPEGRHNLDHLAEVHLHYRPITFDELLRGAKPTSENILNIQLQRLSDYACEDADVTLQLYRIASEKIEREGMTELFYDIEMPLLLVLADMEAAGVALDIAELQNFGNHLKKEIQEVEQQIFQLTGFQFNIQSARQLGEVLFEHLKIAEKPMRTKTKQYATGEEILQQYIDRHPIVPLILQYRTLQKLLSTYVEALPRYIEPSTGRIHAMFHQTVTATGRLSSSNPNLQNIPIRTEYGQEIRKAFVAGNKDSLLLSADYSQIELRVMAAISGEVAMIEDFQMGYDIHSATAARLFQIPIEQVNDQHRRKAKMVNFGIIYGISAHGLSQRLGISRKEAAQMIDEYFKKYPAIKQYMQKTIEFARQYGYVKTIKNRKRYIQNLHSSNAIVRGFAERAAINTPIQGSAADIMKVAMVNIHQCLKQNQMKSKLIMQVHDELILEVTQDELEPIRNIVADEMKKAFSSCICQVPVDVHISWGSNWFEAH